MNRNDAKALALHHMGLHGLTRGWGWTFQFNRARTSAGQCRWYRGRIGGEIRLSGPFVDLNEQPAVEDTILHEIAHALAGRQAGHGPLWKAACRTIGARPERTICASQIVAPARQWHGSCPSCGQDARPRHRKPRKPLVCGVCYRKAQKDPFGGMFTNIPPIVWRKETA